MTKRHWILLAVSSGLFAWLFAGALFSDSTFAFRDAAHYYYPLLEFNKNEWSAGRVPLWNPHEGLGVPLAASATGSVFYPGTLIFALPIGYAWTYKLYVMGHVLLAAGTAFGLARHFRTRVAAAGVAAISYAFAGNVLYQYCNVVFLVGAAWLPFALLAIDRMLVERSLCWSAVLGAVLAMTTLGGDPQTAYHIGLLAALYALLLWWQGESVSVGPVRSRFVLLAVAAVLGLVLSAVQVFPSIQFTEHSSRSVSSVARSVWELPGRLGNGDPGGGAAKPDERAGRHWSDGLLCRRIPQGTHHEHVYHFSVGPWRLAEYVWPNVGGRQFPIHRRWFEAIPGEGRVWVPSFYMGVLPLVLALASIRLWRGEVWVRWLSWSVVLGTVASFGWYGLGWLAGEIALALGADASDPLYIGAPAGGLYWLLTVLLPGYIHFRYPAKWLTVTAVGLSLLAARGWDRAFAASENDGNDRAARPSKNSGFTISGAMGGVSALAWLRFGKGGQAAPGTLSPFQRTADGPETRAMTASTDRLRRTLLVLGAISLLGAVAACCVRPFWHGWFADVPPDSLFGPLNTAGAANDLLLALVATAGTCGLSWWLLEPLRRGRGWVQPAALVLVAIDLAAANAWMVVCAPARYWQNVPLVADLLDDEEVRSGDGQPYRVFRRGVWMPRTFAESASAGRLGEAVRWDHNTLWPKYNLSAGISLAEVSGTMMLYDYQIFLREARRRREGAVPDPESLGAVNTKYLILRGDETFPGAEPIGGGRIRSAGLDDVSVWRNRESLPRTWIVHRVEVLPAIDSRDPDQVSRRTEEVFWPEGSRRDLRVEAVVEREDSGPDPVGMPLDLSDVASPKPGAAVGDLSSERCRVVGYAPLCVEIAAELTEPGLVVLGDQFYPGWQLEVHTVGRPIRRVPILRTNRVMRGAWLSAGSHRLVYRYRPPVFFWGLIVSGLGWFGLGAVGGWKAVRRNPC